MTDSKKPETDIFKTEDPHPEHAVVPDPAQKELKKELEKGLEQSFPASDPPSVSQPTTNGSERKSPSKAA